MSESGQGAAREPVQIENPELRRAMQSLRENRPQAAESILRGHLQAHPGDVLAMSMLAETVLRFERNDEAEELLKRAIGINPDFPGPRHTLVTVLLLQKKPDEAFAQLAELLKRDPGNPNHHALKAMAHAWVGQHAEAAAAYEIVLAAGPQQPGPWLAHGHALRTIGRSEEAAAAYRRAMTRFPKLGDAFWSLANLKSARFTDAEVESMRGLAGATDVAVESRVQIHFALAKALEDRKDYEASFEHYKQANALKRATLGYNPEMTSVYVQNCETLFTPKYFEQFEGAGAKARDPIFVVGLPRSGSTLVEQILASHSQIEGTMELRVLPYLVGRIGSRTSPQFRPGQSHPALATDSQAPYPECLRNLDAGDLKLLGEEYLGRAAMHRNSARPRFVDKMPDNFAHIGLIHLMLPNAKIVDVRRHPLACCVSCFKHYFPLGKDFSYSLGDLGRFYADYVELMAHWDAVLPGKVHRVFYERLIDDTEGEIRRMFEYLELPFEPAMLRFHETERAVRTPSAEQVRRPIFRDELENWRHFEPWLEPLKSALGPALDGYAGSLARGR